MLHIPVGKNITGTLFWQGCNGKYSFPGGGGGGELISAYFLKENEHEKGENVKENEKVEKRKSG